MADLHYGDETAEGIGLNRLEQLVRLAGAALSVALVVGLVLWGYRLAMRDVTGIPVVQALDEPMRVAPADPGGEIAGNMGLSVNAIAAEGALPPPPDQLVLAPRPVDLTEEDQPFAAAVTGAAAEGAAPAPASAGLAAAEAPFVPTAPVEMPTETVLAPPADALPGPDAAAGADLAGGIDVAPLDEGAPAPATEALPEPGLAEPVEPLVIEAAAEPLPEAEPGPAPEGAVVRSLRPVRRPTETVVLASLGEAAAEPVVAVVAVEPAAIASGTRLVQLGAFDNAEDAVEEWNRLVAQFGDLIAVKTRVIQDAQSGGRNFVRLRAMGFADEADARRFCSALLSENAACIPVAQR